MTRLVLTAVLGAAILLFASPAMAQAPDNSLYAALLRQYVNEQGLVDYAGLKRDEQTLDQYLKILSATKRDALSRDDLYAFYINVYNAFTLKLILKHYPVKSIRDIGSIFKGPWKQEFVVLEGKTYHLDNIEHDILRPTFKDARVHFAVNCSAKSCPPLLREPYEGARIHQQLDQVATAFINDPKWTRLEGERLHATKIMDWFGEDFTPSIPAFVRRFAQGDLKRSLDALGDRVQVRFQDYDWALNSQ